jgi:hypothetical protein
MKKTIIHEFSPEIYPVKLWVTITNDLKGVAERFNEYPSMESYDTYFSPKVDAFVDTVSEKEIKSIGFIVVFKKKEYCDEGTIAHEATHISDRLWDHLGEEVKGREANAYFVEWVVNCINRVKNGKTN